MKVLISLSSPIYKQRTSTTKKPIKKYTAAQKKEKRAAIKNQQQLLLKLEAKWHEMSDELKAAKAKKTSKAKIAELTKKNERLKTRYNDKLHLITVLSKRLEKFS